MDDHGGGNYILDSLIKRKRVLIATKKYQHNMLNRGSSDSVNNFNITEEKKQIEKPKVSCSDINKSSGSLDSVVENSDDENIWPTRKIKKETKGLVRGSSVNNFNITEEKEQIEKPKVSCSDINKSSGSLDSVVENSDDEKIWPTNKIDAGTEHKSVDNISLKRKVTGEPSIDHDSDPEVNPMKIKKETKKVVILSNIVLTPKQSSFLFKTTTTSLDDHAESNEVVKPIQNTLPKCSAVPQLCSNQDPTIIKAINPSQSHAVTVGKSSSSPLLHPMTVKSEITNVSKQEDSIIIPPVSADSATTAPLIGILQPSVCIISPLSPGESTYNIKVPQTAIVTETASSLPDLGPTNVPTPADSEGILQSPADTLNVLSTLSPQPSASILTFPSPDIFLDAAVAPSGQVSNPSDSVSDALINPITGIFEPISRVSNSPLENKFADSTAATSKNICFSPFNVSTDNIELPSEDVLHPAADALCSSLLDVLTAEPVPTCSKILTSEINNVLENKDTDNSTQLESVKEKRRKTNKFRKSYIDFVSDNEDFSDGSSDNWTAKESESSSDGELSKTKRKKKKKATQENTVIPKKRIRKLNKLQQMKKNRDQGNKYITKSGNEVQERSIKENPCVEGKCGRGCYKIPEQRRKSLFDFYWGLEPQRRRDWLVRCARQVPVKRQKTKQDISRRQNTYEYYLNSGEDHLQICQQFLLKTLDITQKFLLYTIKNANEEVAQKDKRHSNAPVVNESTKRFARNYLENLPAVPSHYCRKDSTCVYLPQEFKNLANVYRLYCLECTSQEQPCLTEASFNKIFREEYNIRIHAPKKDKCSQCVAFENKTNKDPTDIDNMTKHIEEKKATYRRFKFHQNLQDNKTIVCSFDLQKVLNTPYGESMLLYYSRKYAVYNLTMYESKTQNVSCYIWGECDGKRGSNEIASCLYKYLKEVDERGTIKNVLLYCDSCSGQNKNKVVLAAISHFLHISNNIEVVQLNYLLPGHTYMPVDSVHAVIENEVKKVIVWSPDQWPTFIESARKRPKPYNVNVIEYTEFNNWNTITEETFTKNTLKEIKMRDIRVVTLKKKDLKKIEVKYSMKDDVETYSTELFQKTIGKGKGRGKVKRGRDEKTGPESQMSSKTVFDLPRLYENRLCISKAKSIDLKRLCEKNIIPRRFHDVYFNLPVADDVKDVLPDTDTDDRDID